LRDLAFAHKYSRTRVTMHDLRSFLESKGILDQNTSESLAFVWRIRNMVAHSSGDVSSKDAKEFLPNCSRSPKHPDECVILSASKEPESVPELSSVVAWCLCAPVIPYMTMHFKKIRSLVQYTFRTLKPTLP